MEETIHGIHAVPAGDYFINLCLCESRPFNAGERYTNNSCLITCPKCKEITGPPKDENFHKRGQLVSNFSFWAGASASFANDAHFWFQHNVCNVTLSDGTIITRRNLSGDRSMVYYEFDIEYTDGTKDKAQCLYEVIEKHVKKYGIFTAK